MEAADLVIPEPPPELLDDKYLEYLDGHWIKKENVGRKKHENVTQAVYNLLKLTEPVPFSGRGRVGSTLDHYSRAGQSRTRCHAKPPGLQHPPRLSRLARFPGSGGPLLWTAPSLSGQ